MRKTNGLLKFNTILKIHPIENKHTKDYFILTLNMSCNLKNQIAHYLQIEGEMYSYFLYR